MLRRREHVSLPRFCITLPPLFSQNVQLVLKGTKTRGKRYTHTHTHSFFLCLALMNYFGSSVLEFIFMSKLMSKLRFLSVIMTHINWMIPFCLSYEVMTMKNISFIKINCNIFNLVFFGFCTMKTLWGKNYSRVAEGEDSSLCSGVQILFLLPSRTCFLKLHKLVSYSFFSIKEDD